MGVGPNGFKELYDMGFSFGKELFHIVNYNDTDKTHLRNTDILTHLSDHDTKDAIIEKVKNIFKNCNMILNKNGISNCIESSVEVFNLSDDNSLKIRYNVYAKPNSFQSIRQKYSIKFFDENEEDFFNTIRDGNIDGNIKESFTQRIIEKLNKLNIDSWSQQLYPYDWFILGIHKGILYKGLLELKFDDWVKRFIKHPEPRYEQYLKESIVTNIKASSESVLQFEMTYESRDVYTDDSKT
jgi:hypothetical protein